MRVDPRAPYKLGALILFILSLVLLGQRADASTLIAATDADGVDIHPGDLFAAVEVQSVDADGSLASDVVPMSEAVRLEGQEHPAHPVQYLLLDSLDYDGARRARFLNADGTGGPWSDWMPGCEVVDRAGLPGFRDAGDGTIGIPESSYYRRNWSYLEYGYAIEVLRRFGERCE